jgi:hypothetical protein
LDSRICAALEEFRFPIGSLVHISLSPSGEVKVVISWVKPGANANCQWHLLWSDTPKNLFCPTARIISSVVIIGASKKALIARLLAL